MADPRCLICLSRIPEGTTYAEHVASHIGPGYRTIAGQFVGRKHVGTTPSGNSRWRVAFQDGGGMPREYRTQADASAGYTVQNLHRGDLALFAITQSGTLAAIFPISID